MTTRGRRCYACGAEFASEQVPMQASYRGKTSMRVYAPATLQTRCPRGHRVEVGVVLPEDLGA